MLVSRAAIEAVGAFDERLFFLYEDVEWSLRIRAAGFSVVFVPRARVMHAVAASQAGAERTPLTSYYGIRNNLAVCQMYAPYRGLRELRRELACLATHAWGLRHVPQRASNAKALIAGLRDFRRGRLGPGPTWLRGRAAARGAAESEAPLGP
jgi:GT2 family glycosyltransferase